MGLAGEVEHPLRARPGRRCSVSGSTVIWLTTLPATRFSIAQHEVRQVDAVHRRAEQTLRSRKTIFLSGCCVGQALDQVELGADRPLRCPAGAASMVLMMNSVEPTRSAFWTTSQRALGVHEDLDARVLGAHAGRRARAVKRPCTEQWPFHRIISRAAAAPRRCCRRSGWCGSHTTSRSSGMPIAYGGVAPEVLVGEEEDLGVGLCSKAHSRHVRRWRTCRRRRRCGRRTP